MPRVSRKKTRRGGGRRRTRRMKGGANYLARDTRQPINEDLFAQPQQLQRIPSGVMNLNSSSDKRAEINYVRDMDYLDKRITFEVGSELIHIRQDIKNLSNEMKELKKENNILKQVLVSLGVD
jgi:hypothetical protein